MDFVSTLHFLAIVANGDDPVKLPRALFPVCKTEIGNIG
jgi:hypothetical protein